MNTGVLRDFTIEMRLRNLSPITITDRLEEVDRLARWLPCGLLDADAEQLERWQRTLGGKSPATVDIYTRHVQSFYRWAHQRGRIAVDPSTDLIRPRMARGTPHPVSRTDLRTVFACTGGVLRIVFALAAFAGLRRGEICGLQRADVDMAECQLRVFGKGRKTRRVPLIPPLADEIRLWLPRTGYVVTDEQGRPLNLDALSAACRRHLTDIGIDATLHSFRHSFATEVQAGTHDIQLVAELLGHASLNTARIYALPDLNPARLAPLSELASSMLGGDFRLAAVN